MARGGKRVGAGRPQGTGKFGEATKAIRIPISEVETVLRFVQHKFYRLPFYQDAISAGLPSSAEDAIDNQVDLNDLLIKHPLTTFFLKVSGSSMINAGIHHNDILIVDRSVEPSSGKIVIAALNGELTVKRLSIEGKKIRLIPENDHYQPIEITDDCSLHIWGVVTNVIHHV
jgi:DNA polymerase V